MNDPTPHHPNRLGALTLGFALATAILASSAGAGGFPWPDKNGPTFNGQAAAADAKGLPTTWNESTKENIAWKTPLEGQGHSTPVIAHGSASRAATAAART